MRTFTQKPKVTQQTTSSKSKKPSRSFVGQSRDVHSILHLQHTIGNQAVLRLLQTETENINTSSVSNKSNRFAHDFSRIPVYPSTRNGIQPKLKVNAPGDQYEQEADRIASQVLRHKRAENEEEKTFQSKACSHQYPNPSSNLKNPIAALQGGGQPLPHSEQAFFEPRFGTDFSRVRVHADRQAAETARTVNARAFTVGRDIVFGAGEYQPRASEGRKLLAHELAHVVQQGSESNSMASSHSMIQRDDVTQMSITPQYARGLSDEELREQIQILTEQTLDFEFLGTSTLDGEEEVTQSNLSILQAEQRRRQRRHESERRRRNRAVTEVSITPQHAETLSYEDLHEQIRILSDQIAELEFLRTPGIEGEEEVAQSNLSILQEEQRRRNRAVTQMSITPQHAEALSDEDLREQIRILAEQTIELEFLRTPGIQVEEEVAQSNLLILQEEQRARRAQQRRRIRRTNWGSFRRASDVTASGVTVDDRILYLMEALVEQYGYPINSAAALVGNISSETGGTFIPNIVERGGLAQRGEPVPQGGGVGLVQWTGPRRTAFLGTERGTDILFNMDAQIEYMVNELQRSYQRVNNVLNDPESLEQATSEVFMNYETPQVVVDWRNARRANNQEEILRTQRIMDSRSRRRLRAATRARDIYLRERHEP